MLEGELSRIHRHLRAHPEDGEAWLELASLVARSAGPPPDLAPAALPRLLALWAEVPRNRTLGTLVLPLLGLEADRSPYPPGEWWSRKGRGEVAAEQVFDGETGLPVHARRVADGAPMVLVPGGTFWRGRDDGEVDERPEQRIHLDPFYLDRFPVTVARFLAHRPEGSPDHPQAGHPHQPIVQVSRADAHAYATLVGARLPTEAEWERAARGDDDRRFPWGDAPLDPTRCNFARDRVARPEEDWLEALAPVDAHPAGASPFGVQDMLGNAYEFCADPYDPRYYARAPRDDPRGPEPRGDPPEYATWVLRGGWWGAPPEDLSVTRRHARHSNWRSHDAGFRLARSLRAS